MKKHRSLRISRPVFQLTSLILITAFLTSIYAVLPRNVLSDHVPKSARVTISTLWPQGWGFFTKDPDSPDIDVYKETSTGQTKSLLVTPQGRPSNLFGLSRTGRAQGPEIAILNDLIDEDEWVACTTENIGCLESARSAEAIKLTNTSPSPTICGRVIFTSEIPIPWSYRSYSEETHRIQATVNAILTCTRSEDR